MFRTQLTAVAGTCGNIKDQNLQGTFWELMTQTGTIPEFPLEAEETRNIAGRFECLLRRSLYIKINL